jgi:hypothetical protein
MNNGSRGFLLEVKVKLLPERRCTERICGWITDFMEVDVRHVLQAKKCEKVLSL